MKVIRLLRERTLGNGPTRLWRQLQESHSEAWAIRCLKFLTDCDSFRKGSVFLSGNPQDPPEAKVPSKKWVMTVYINDIMSRLPEVKAQITSTFGRILKVDSTRKVLLQF